MCSFANFLIAEQLIKKISTNAPDFTEFEWHYPAKLGAQGASAVVEPLNWRNTFLRVLRLSNQQLGDLGVSYVAKSMKSNRTIEVLDLSGNSVTSKGVECLVDALLLNEGRFVIGGVVSTPNTTPIPGDASHSSNTMATPEILTHTTLSSRGGSALRHLDLSHNLIDFSGCGHIARLITNAESITTLLLNNNLLNDVGLTTIANALALNCSLARIDLQFNPVSQNMAVGPIFANVLETSNYTLTQLDLGGARISESDIILIQSSLTRNALLHDERLSSNEHASPRENAFKRMEIGPTAISHTGALIPTSPPSNPDPNAKPSSARLHVFHADVLSPAAILRLVVTPLGANIISLIITNCNLTKLPPQLCLLNQLEILDVRRNKLTELPLEIRGFFKLKRLHLAHNYLQHLPPGLTSLHSLDAISLQGNPLQWIPQDVVSHAEIEDFPPADTRLFKFLGEAASSANAEDHSLHGKIMILGQVHSGKTSLCQLLDSSFGAEVTVDSPPPATTEPREGWSNEMPRYISTEGVCARNIIIQGSKYAATSESSLSPLYSRARLSMSNTSASAQAAAIMAENSAVMRKANFLALEAGGSGIYTAAHSIFFRSDLLYLVTVDLTKLTPEHSRETISELKNTIHSIRTMVGANTAPHAFHAGKSKATSSRGTGPQIAIVGTFEDFLPTPQALIDALSLLKIHFEPYVVEIFSISNKSSRGLSILRDRVLFWSIKARLLSSPQLGCISTVARVLHSYASARPFISNSELEQICKVYGVGSQSNASLPLSASSGASNAQDSKDTEDEIWPSPLDKDGAISILEQIGAVTMFHNDSQLECYAFIDIQFIANVFSDIMAAADADGYIYRSRVPPLLWMDCRRHASMKSLFDWCRLFGLALDCGDSHYIVPSLLNSAPQPSVYASAWPPTELIDGVSSRPHVTSPPRTRPGIGPSGGNSSGGLSHGSLSPSSSAASIHAPIPSSASSSSSGYSSGSSGPMNYANLIGGSTSPGLLPPHQMPSSGSLALPNVSNLPAALRLSPAVEKASRAYQREMSLVSCNEWPVLARGIATDFVPALVFSHLTISVFSLPKIQRCAWWRNGFIVRRDSEFVKVTRESSGHGLASPSTFAVPYRRIPNQSSEQPTTSFATDSGSVKILIEARNDSTYTYSKSLLEEVCGCIDSLLQRWYPQLEYRWAVTWSHPWLSDDETPALSLLQVQEALSRGPIRTPTQIGALTIHEELLMPEVVHHSSFYTRYLNLTETTPEKDSQAESGGLSTSGEGSGTKSGDLSLVPVSPSASELALADISTSSKNTRLYKDPTDGSTVRFREVAENALASTALTLSVLRNERVATLHRVYERPSGLTVYMPKGGTLNDALERTYNDSPLPWAARFRIAVDIVLALKYVHSQVPVRAVQGLDAHSVLLNENFTDPQAAGPIARIDLSATNSQSWLHSIYAPRPFVATISQLAPQASSSPPGTSFAPLSASTISSKTSPHSSDIYSLGVLLLQLWRNEPLEDLISRVRDKLPPVPFYSPESLGLLAYEQLIAACVCDDPSMRPQIDGVITKLHAIAVHLELTSAVKLLAAHEPARRWRKIKTLQVSTASADVSFAISTLCKSSTSPFSKPGTASASISETPVPGSPASKAMVGANLTSGNRSHFMDETTVWAGGVDGVLYGIPFPMPTMMSSPSTALVGAPNPSGTSSGLPSPTLHHQAHPSLMSHQSAAINSPTATIGRSGANAVLGGVGNVATSPSLHWTTMSTSMLDSASIQYRMTSFPPEMRQTRRRILATVTSARHIWCLLNTVTASVLDPARLTLVSQVEIGACLSIASHNDLVYTGGTNGTISVFDGSNFKRLRQREISKLPITAIAASARFVWCALTDDPGKPSILLCLDANTLQEEARYSHSEEDTVTSICLTPFPNSANGEGSASNFSSSAMPTSQATGEVTDDVSNAQTSSSNPSLQSPPYAGSTPASVGVGMGINNNMTEIMWTGGYSGTVFTFKVTRSPYIDMSDIKVEPLSTHRNVHRTRILNFLWNGDYVYSSSNDSIAAWKSDGSGTASHLSLPTVDIASFTTLEKNCLITGHKNGSVTVWASV